MARMAVLMAARGMAKGGNGMGMALRTLGMLAVAVPAILGLPACSERALDTGLLGSVTGEPSPVGDRSPQIRAMTGERTDYPNLASVPPRPTGLSTEAQRQTQMDKLAEDRSRSRKRKAATEAIPMPTPLPVPPPPNLKAGKS